MNAFVKQYAYNTELDVTVRDLETTGQDSRESFAMFLTRWRKKVVEVTNRRIDKE